ncbi:uncharacterized protein VTP21DRAFT_2754 [Calcarisporiella thermophila]|uniref:uncharacterized protein n=1 Tax=Calcarisporiella thermophila TaxID=911321 RepID=UPI003743D4E6
MKFGEELKKQILPSWRFYYLDYNRLKQCLFDNTTGGEVFGEREEECFVELLEKELDKVYSFQYVKFGEINRRIQFLEKHIRSCANFEDSSQHSISRNLLHLVHDIQELTRFSRLNYTGFVKILKKHDKRTPFRIKSHFMTRLNLKSSFREDQMDPLILRLSQLFDLQRRQGQKEGKMMKATTPDVQRFVRMSTKYWVHIDNIYPLKLFVLRHLPVLQPQTSNPGADTITSVYFDNDELNLYKDRVEKREGAEVIRLRWYGRTHSRVFVERKRHHGDWTGEEHETKDRFCIKGRSVSAFLLGDTDVIERGTEKMRGHGEPDEMIERYKQLAREIQITIGEQRLKPLLRTVYRRTAFQIPGDESVRISLDTDFVVAREEGIRSEQLWQPSEAVETKLGEEEEPKICKFPFAVLEIKLKLEYGQDPPLWVQELKQSPLIEEVAHFSKFVHAVASLYESRVSLLPFWLPWVDKDIRKYILPSEHSHRPPVSRSTTNTSLNTGTVEGGCSSKISQSSTSVTIEEDMSKCTSISSVVDTTEKSPLIANKLSSHNNYDAIRDRGFEARQAGEEERFNDEGVLSAGASSWSLGTLLEAGCRSKQSFPTNRATSQKQPRTPPAVDGESLIFYANEHTLLSWLNFTAILAGISLILMNFGDSVGRFSSSLFMCLCIGCVIYAVYRYEKRAIMIRRREEGSYDDLIGPIIISIALISILLLNFYLILNVQEEEQNSPQLPPGPSGALVHAG